jgi:hypothetical protein
MALTAWLSSVEYNIHWILNSNLNNHFTNSSEHQLLISCNYFSTLTGQYFSVDCSQDRQDLAAGKDDICPISCAQGLVQCDPSATCEKHSDGVCYCKYSSSRTATILLIVFLICGFFSCAFCFWYYRRRRLSALSMYHQQRQLQVAQPIYYPQGAYAAQPQQQFPGQPMTLNSPTQSAVAPSPAYAYPVGTYAAAPVQGEVVYAQPVYAMPLNPNQVQFTMQNPSQNQTSH